MNRATIQTVGITDLTLIRVTCKDCGGTVELACDSAPPMFANGNCPLCSKQLLPAGDKSLRLLTDAIRDLAKSSKAMTVEFVIKDE